MTKREFRTALETRLNERNPSKEAIDSALGKLARHTKNRDGVTTWQEDDIENAVCFFNEFGNQKTFNRDRYYERL